MITPKGRLPNQPLNNLVLCRPYPVAEMNGLIYIPEGDRQYRAGGFVLAAGLRALDAMHDNDIRIGDEVHWGQYAGVWSEFDHIVEDGSDRTCDHWDENAECWGARKKLNDRTYEWTCAKCGAVRRSEPVWVIKGEDLLANVSQARRLAEGAITIERDPRAQQTTHVIVRHDKEQ